MCSVEFVVIKIDGSDISQLPRYEAVQMFLQAKETIVVELCRRRAARCENECSGNNSKKQFINALSTEPTENCCKDEIGSKIENLYISKRNTDDIIENISASTPLVTTETPINKNEVAIAKSEKLILTLNTNADDLKSSEFSCVSKCLNYATRETQTDNKPKVKQLNNDTTYPNNVLDFTEQEHNLFEQCLEPEIDIEEITLSKTGVKSNDCIGISVCCGGAWSSRDGSGSSIIGGSVVVDDLGTLNNNNSNSNSSGGGVGACALTISEQNDIYAEVFISDIHSNSIAERDGRLRRGDQIIQINGKDIKSKDEADKLISDCSNSITLLVSRYVYPDEVGSDDEDDYDDEYFEDRNLEYTNGFLQSNYTNVVDKLDKVLLNAQPNQEEQLNKPLQCVDMFHASQSENNPLLFPKQLSSLVSNKLLSEEKIKTKLKHDTTSLLAHDSEVFQEQAFQNNVKSANRKSKENTNHELAIGGVQKTCLGYDDAEHIYETIPEDSESEPLYCSPYQSSNYMTAVGSCSSANTTDPIELQQQKQRVAQWLGIKPPLHAMTMNCLSANTGRSSLATGSFNNARITGSMVQRSSYKIGHGTLRSAITNTTSGSSSSGGGFNCPSTSMLRDAVNLGDDLDNSSSAYNTGGSNNSASPMVLFLNKQHPTLQQDCNYHSLSFTNTKLQFHGGTNMVLNKTQQVQSPKEPTIASPRSNGPPNGFTDQVSPTEDIQISAKPNSQSQYFRNHQQSLHCPQFNAPNLSQYHFVSSQEVATAVIPKNLNITSPKSAMTATTGVTELSKSVVEETQMVWKVKRRQDGTRYIVRRPLRNPVISVGNVVRKPIRNVNDVTTTEDDTISEVKIGRYWTKEERKRHIERARERRVHHQQQQQQLNLH